MKKIYFLFVFTFSFLISFGQKIYFSDKPYDFCQVPDVPVTSDFNFSDESPIYGLIVFEGTNIGDGAKNDYGKFKTAYVSDRTFVISVLGKKKRSGTFVDNGDGNLYLYFNILPEPDRNIDEGLKDWKEIWELLPEGKPTKITISSKPDAYTSIPVKFKFSITLTKTGKYSVEDLKTIFRDAEENATSFYNQASAENDDVKDAELGLSKAYQRSFDQQYVPLNLSDAELSLENISNMVEKTLGKKVEVVQVSTSKQNNEWEVVNDATGKILYKESAHMVIVYKDVATGWCFARAFYVRKQYDGTSYGDAYVTFAQAGLGTHRCNCSKVVFNR